MPYDKPNVQTAAEIIASSPNGAQEAWAELLIRKSHDYSLLKDNLSGPIGSGKAFCQHNDLKVTAGNTVNIPMVGGTRGPGVQGAGDRLGNEKKLKAKDYQFKVGRWWNGFAIDSVALEETIIGSRWDQAAQLYLRRNLGIKQVDDMLMELRARAEEGHNIVRPNNKANRNALRTADVFSTGVITRSQSVLVGLGAKPVSIGKSSAGAPIRKFLHLGTHHSLEKFRTSQTYLDALTHGDSRGEFNALFTGNILPWQGNPIYQWDVEDPDDIAPAGCPLVPRAFLGAVITGGTAAFNILGGGNAEAAADTDVLFLGYFSNAAWIGAEGVKITASTATERYVGIQIQTGADAGKILYCSYTVNNGNRITGVKKLGSAANGTVATTVGAITWGTGTYGSNNVALADGDSVTIPVGSLIQEVNNVGVPIAFNLGLGEMAGYFGHGSIDGKQAMGKRTEEHTNHGMDHAIGIETVFGSRASEGLDGKVRGYTLIESALDLPGWPVVA